MKMTNRSYEEMKVMRFNKLNNHHINVHIYMITCSFSSCSIVISSFIFVLQFLSCFAHFNFITHSMAKSSTTDCLPSYPYSDYAEIVVVRHGETAWNSQRRVQGQVDIELNETGRQQAVKVGNRLSREPKISAIYSSDLQRAFKTAQIIAIKCGGLEVVKDLDLRERHMGDLQGLVYPELAKTNPIGYEALKSMNHDQELPGGGESYAQLSERCKSALQRIGKKHKGERVVVVTHGASIETLYKWANAEGGYAGKIGNASIAVFRFYSEDKWTLNMWGDVSHLKQN